MYTGTALLHLQKGRGRRQRGLEWQQAGRSAKKPLSTKLAAPQTYDVPDRCSEQIKLRENGMKEMEHLNTNYNSDYCSSLGVQF